MSFVQFWCIWYRLVALQNSVQNGPNWCKSLCHEVVSKVLYYFGAFGIVWLRYNTLCKMDQTSAKVRAMKSWQNFSQRTHPIHPIGL